MISTCLLGGTVVPLDGSRIVYDPGAVVFSNGIIQYVGPENAAVYNPLETRIIDCRDKIILPGLVNTHTHTGMTYFRNLLEDVHSDLWFSREMSAEKQLNDDDIYNAATLGACEMLRQGITTIADRFHHMKIIAAALEKTGIRAVVAASLTDQNSDIRVKEAVELLEKYGVSGNGLIHAGLGPVAPDRCSTRLLEWTRRQADRLGAQIFIHVAQSQQELLEIKSRGYNGSVRYLDALGILGPDVVAAHCMYIDLDEMDILARRGVKVAHCPASNAKIEGIVAPVLALQSRGLIIGLGTDCTSANNRMDMFDEMRTAGLLHKTAGHDPTLMASFQLLEMATLNAARCLNLDQSTGSLQPGKFADIITLNRWHLNLQPWNDLFSGLVYSARGLDVEDVWVNGVLRVEKGVVLLDELPQVLQIAARWAAALPAQWTSLNSSIKKIPEV